MVKSVPGGPDANLKNSQFTASNPAPSTYIMNGQISQQGVQAAANTGLIDLATYQKQLAAAPVYTPPSVITSTLNALTPAGSSTIMGISWIWWALVGGGVLYFATKKSKR
jgi:hypothetical protein